MSRPSRIEKNASCPLCRKSAQAQFRPFCSQGCRDRDLLNWLGEGYRVPGPPADPELGASGVDSTPPAPL
jgi:uncharacterized protein